MLVLVLRLVLGATLLWAAIAKFANLARFSVAVRTLAVVPAPFVKPISWLIPACEFVLGALLLVGYGVPLVAAFAGALLLGFTAIIIFNIRRGHRVACACFGASATPLGAEAVIRNLCLFFAALALTWFGQSSVAYHDWPELVSAAIVALWVILLGPLIAAAFRVRRTVNQMGHQ